MTSDVSSIQELFYQRLDSRLRQVKPALQAFASWVEQRVMLPSGPFRFEGHEFLREIYGDDHPHRCFEKPSQIGLSTHVLAKASYKCKHQFRQGVIYYMPTDRHVSEFCKGIADPFFELNPGLLADGRKASDSMRMKRLGFAHLFFRGLQTTMQAKSIPADMLVFDEVDEITAHARRSALQRISHSSYGYVDELSIPSIPETGIDAVFQSSDQRHWLVRCEACRADHCLEEEFPHCLRRQGGRVLRICQRCGAELDINRGRWVAKRPGVKDVRGYHLSQLFAPWIPPEVILDEFEQGENLDVFFNERIGLPFVLAENELKREQVLALCGDVPRAHSGQEEVVAGIDQGKDLHVAVVGMGAAGRPRLVGLEVFRDEEKAREYLQRFRLVGGVIDALPETRVADKFVAWFPGKFFRNFYRERPAREMVSWDETRNVVMSDRTHSLDALYEGLRGGDWALPARDRETETLATHVFHLKRKRVTNDDTGDVRYEYVRTGADHYAHALNYAAVALARFKVRHVKGAAYKAMGEAHVIPPVSLPRLDSPVDLHFALVPHDRLPWVGVWAAADRAGVVAVVREEEFDGVTLATFARRLAAAEATDPKPPLDRYLPQAYAELSPGAKELTFAERLEDHGLEFTPVECPESLAVVKIREALALREDLANPMPGLVVARDCPSVIEALRLHRPGLKPETDDEERLALYHQAVALILVQDPQAREKKWRRRR